MWCKGHWQNQITANKILSWRQSLQILLLLLQNSAEVAAAPPELTNSRVANKVEKQRAAMIDAISDSRSRSPSNFLGESQQRPLRRIT
jgi:hypothetical protein